MATTSRKTKTTTLETSITIHTHSSSLEPESVGFTGATSGGLSGPGGSSSGVGVGGKIGSDGPGGVGVGRGSGDGVGPGGSVGEGSGSSGRFGL